jgi:hypothetical protein
MRNVDKQELERIYEIIGKDPQTWLAQARQLKISADAILPALEEALSLPPSSPGTQETRFAYIHSYMLLNGLVFENLIKGILIGRNPVHVTKEKITRGILTRGGHGIANGAKNILTPTLIDQELDLLKRMEEYLLWAGRYPLPLQFDTYKNSEEQALRRYTSNDRAIINHLFDRLVMILQQEWQARS